MNATERVLDRLDGVKQTAPDRWIARCPAHEDRSPSLSIRQIGDGRVLLHCFSGCQIGDILAAIGLELRDLYEGPLGQQFQPSHSRIPALDVLATYKPWRDVAAHLWERSRPLHGSLAATYLQRRGCRLPPADGDLRYSPAHGKYPAAMLGRITDAVTGEPISLHRTYLSPDATKAGDDAKRYLPGHRKAGGVIRLWPNEAVTRAVAISEGIESGLAAAHGFTPVWAALDADNLGKIPVLDGIDALTVVADRDAVGLSAARACATRWADAGREVRIATPRISGRDAADLVAPVSA
jgi:hypothetical protein